MREDEEAERALALGAPLDRVWVTGNTKFDGLAGPAPSAEDEALRTALGLPLDAPVLMAGSTHEGEEEQLLAVWQRLPRAAPPAATGAGAALRGSRGAGAGAGPGARRRGRATELADRRAPR